MKASRIGLFFFLMGFNFYALAQLPVRSEAFSKNRVQHQNFQWRYLSSPNFDVHFYGKGESIARQSLRIAEEEYRYITRQIGFSPYNKIKIFLYASVSDLQQSNLGERDQDFSLGGQTNFQKSVIELAFTGDRNSYRRELIREITDALLFDMMYGGTLKETLQSSYLLSLPEWFISGASAFVTENWSQEMDDFVRTHLFERRFEKPDIYTGYQATHIGHSIWNYIALKYGNTAVANILNLTRIVRNERTAIQNSLGIPYNTFIDQWQGFYRSQYKGLYEEHQNAAPTQSLRKLASRYTYHQVRLSPDAAQIAYSENYRGWYRVWIEPATPEGNKRRKAFRGGHYVINQKIDQQMPLLDWQNNQTLAMISTRNGKTILSLLDLQTRKETRQTFDYFDNIQHFAFDPTGFQIVLSAENQGQNDLYLYQIRSKNLQRLTNDTFDNRSPVFWDQNRIVFSSNRTLDSLGNEEPSDFFNLFARDAEGKYQQLTNFASHESQPLAVGGDEILYLSDQRGIQHLFRYNAAENTNHQITRFSADIHAYDFRQKKLALRQQTPKGDRIFIYPDFDTQTNIFTNKTARQNFQDRLMLEQRRKTSRPSPSKEKERPATRPKDSTATDSTINTDDYTFDTFGERSEPRPKLQQAPPPPKADTPTSKLPTSPPTTTGPHTYQSLFSFDRSLISPAFDAFRNLGLLLEVGMTDDLESHRIDAGVFFQGLLSINNGYLFAQYEYLEKRLDYRIRYDRSAISLLEPVYVQRYTLNQLTATVSYPINVVSRLSVSPFVANTRFLAASELSPIVQALPDQTVFYGGASAAFMLDNTIIRGPNIRSGSRLKAEITQYFGVNESQRGFGNLSVDARHYRPLIRGVNLAVRLAYGQFYGQNSQHKQYRLGGVDNWVFQREENRRSDEPFFLSPNDPEAFRRDLSDVLFLQYATPMRGFDYNKLAGNNFLLFNAEIRLPLIDYFNRRSIRSKFFQNFQAVAFTDIGSAWTGISPFNRENALNTVLIQNGPFDIKVSNFTDPFLVGYGFGLRSKILNYFTRFDVAWGLENDVVRSPKFYLSLGYDF
ncbi:MAG: hypothetical protein ACFCUI_02830 [Bernardetiaceae bacterium]